MDGHSFAQCPRFLALASSHNPSSSNPLTADNRLAADGDSHPHSSIALRCTAPPPLYPLVNSPLFHSPAADVSNTAWSATHCTHSTHTLPRTRHEHNASNASAKRTSNMMDADPSCVFSLWSCLLQSASLQLSAVNVSDAAQGAAGAQVQPPPAGIQLVDLTILTDPQQPVRVLDATHPSVKDLITVAPTSLATFVQQSRINIGAAVLATSLGNVEIIAKETSEQLKSALSLHYYVGWMLVLGKVLKEHGGGDITTREQWMTWLTSDATKHYVDRVRKDLSKHWKTPSVQDALRYSNDADIELATPVLSAKAAKKLTDEERAKYRMAINANSTLGSTKLK